MKFLVLAAFLCTLVAATTAQYATKPPVVFQMQNALGGVLRIVYDLSTDNKELIINPNNEEIISGALLSLDDLYNIFPTFGASNRSALPMTTSARLSSAFNNFQNAISGWETALDQRNPDNLASTFKAVENAFLDLAGIVVAL